MSSQAYNQLVEEKHDRQMIRTRNRPLPKDRITQRQAAQISGSLVALSVMSYGLMAKPSCMIVAGTIWAGYCFLYTPLKRITIHNTFIGAVVGALPPLIGA